MKKTTTLFALLFILACVFYVPGAAYGESLAESKRLFNFTGTESFNEKQLSIAAVRQQEIQVRFDAIDSMQAEQIEIPLFDGASINAVQRQTEGFTLHKTDSFSWTGKIYENGFEGDVILTVYQNAMSGLIFAPNGVFSIIPQADGRHVLVEIDQSLFPSEKNDAHAVVASGKGGLDVTSKIFGNLVSTEQPGAEFAPNADDGSQIDVMIVYSDDVRAFLGGTAQAQAFAQQAITLTNTAYQNSQITPRLNLVHTMEINRTETTGVSAELNFIRNDATVAAARNTYKADAVGFFVQSPTDACGVASLMGVNNHNSSFQSSAYSVSVRSCAVDNLTFPHELGHNQGSNHDPDYGVTPAQAVFTYAFGHYVNGSYRTVMAYANNCNLGCTRRPYFSNPNVSFNGQPTGISNQRYNAQVINNTALIVSQFRQSVPTAASVLVGGRVVGADGRGVRTARVTMIEQDGTTRTVLTSAFGYYRFDDVAAGQNVVIQAAAKRTQFNPSTQVVTVNGQTEAVNFAAAN